MFHTIAENLLDRLITFVLDSKLIENKNKYDALKVLQCLQYIRNNLSNIETFIDKPDQTKLRYLSFYDQKHGLLRDNDGTSFHITLYSNGKDASKAYCDALIQLEYILKELPEFLWIKFVEHLEYNEKIGCIAARLAPAIKWAVEYLSIPLPNLNDIMQDCVKLQNKDSSQSIVTIAKKYCSDRGYTHCYFNTKRERITDELLKEYAKSTLGEDDDITQLPELKTSYEQLCKVAIISIPENTNTVDIFFHDFDAAFLLLNWLKEQECLKDTNIDKVIIHTIDYPGRQIEYHIRLSKLQHTLLVTSDLPNPTNKMDETNNIKVDLHDAINKLSEQEFINLIRKSPSEFLDEALVISNEKMDTALCVAMDILEQQSFVMLINKVSSSAINTAIQKIKLVDLLHLYFFTLEPNKLHALLTKIDRDIIDAVISPHYPNSSTLFCIANNIDEMSFNLLINIASVEVVSKLCLYEFANKNNIFLLANERINALNFILNKINQDTMNNIFNQYPNEGFSYVKKILLNTKLVTPAEVIEKIFISFPKLYQDVLNRWIELSPLSQSFIEAIAYLIQKKSKPNLCARERDFLHWYQNDGDEGFIKQNNQFIIKTTSQNFINQIWENGLTSWLQYRYLRFIQADRPGLRHILDSLLRANLLFIGSQVFLTDYLEFNKYTGHDDCFRKINEIIYANQGLIKIVKLDNWNAMVAQLKDFNYRPKLRADIDKTSTHKFIHLTEKTAKYQHKKTDQILNKRHHHTRKTSVTLLSKNRSSTLFGEHDKKRELVGLLLQLNPSQIKAMLKYDTGTYFRRWVGTQTSVTKYAKYLSGKSINFTSLSAFVDYVNDNPNTLNEMLVKLSRSNLAAIVIARDTPKARSIARSRFKDIQSDLNISLPVIFYDNNISTIRQYDPVEMYDDEKSLEIGETFNSINEMAAKQNLIALLCELKQKTSWNKRILFFKIKTESPPNTIETIINKISAAQNDEYHGKSHWKITEAEIKKILIDSINANRLLRVEDTQECYKTLNTRYFNS